MKSKVYTLLVGIYFGIVLVKTQVVSWFEIHDMFLLKDPYMYLVIASAIGVGIVSVYFIKRYQPKALCGADIIISKKPFHNGIIFGGTLFGMGWAITGACPGPIYAQIGSGTLLTIFTFLGAISGMYLYAYLQPKLPHAEWERFKPSTTTGTS